jgi:DNA-binding response OmpR family regulator
MEPSEPICLLWATTRADTRLGRELEAQGAVLAHVVEDATNLVHQFQLRDFDALLMEWELPGANPRAVCARLRAEKPLPIIVTSPRYDETSLVLALDAGADDFWVGPLRAREMVARLTAHVRRARGIAEKSSLSAGPLRLDLRSRTCTVRGEPVAVTTNEFELLRALVARANRVVSREALLGSMKGDPGAVFDRAVDVAVYRLRLKLEPDPSRPILLRTIRGVGYMLTTAA